MTLSNSTIETVKATIPVLKVHGTTVIQKFYEILFTRYPAVKAYFNVDRQKGGVSHEEGIPSQVTALAGAVLAYASNIDNLGKILPVVKGICHKHVSRGVEPIQYSAVGECLIAALSTVLGDAATDEILLAWKEAYVHLSGIFIDTENSIREELAEKAGFSGMVDMRVVSSEVSASGGKELGFVPVDYEVPPYGKGQYVAIGVTLGNGAQSMTSMKLVPGVGANLVVHVPESKERASTVLLTTDVGNILKVSMPCGEVKQ